MVRATLCFSWWLTNGASHLLPQLVAPDPGRRKAKGGWHHLPGIAPVNQPAAEPAPIGHLRRHLEQIPGQHRRGRLDLAGCWSSRRIEAALGRDHAGVGCRKRRIVGQPDRHQPH